jgi:hypothetical protein
MQKTRVFVTVVDDAYHGTSIGGVYASTDAAWEDLGEVLSMHVGYVDQRDKADTLPSGSVVCADDPQSGFEIVAWDVDGTPGENMYVVFAEDDNNDYPMAHVRGVFTTYEAARECAVKAFEITVAYDCPDDEKNDQVFGAVVSPTSVRVERLELRAEGRPVMLYSLAEGHE